MVAQPWIIPPPISSQHRLVHRLFREQGVVPTRVVESDNDAVIAALVASGVGIAIIREDVAIEKQAAGEVCIWGKVRISTSLWFIYRRERESEPIIRAMVDVLLDTWNLRCV